MAENRMLVTAAVVNSFGALLLLVGAWVQARVAYRAHVQHRDLEIWVGENHKTASPGVDAPGRGRYERVTTCPGPHFVEPDPHGSLGEVAATLPFLPTPQTFLRRQTFAGWYGWHFIFLGGVLVLCGSVISGLAA
jgi:hypothetical protein